MVKKQKKESGLLICWKYASVHPSVVYNIVGYCDCSSALNVMNCCQTMREVCFAHACLSDLDYCLPNPLIHEHYIQLETRRHSSLFRRYRMATRLTLRFPFIHTSHPFKKKPPIHCLFFFFFYLYLKE